MSALCQKRTLDCARVMSVLPPKADLKTDQRSVRRSSPGSLAIIHRDPPRLVAREQMIKESA
jgi:hypothetical protein